MPAAMVRNRPGFSSVAQPQESGGTGPRGVARARSGQVLPPFLGGTVNINNRENIFSRQKAAPHN